MQIINSPDITNLEVQVTWDISGNVPAVNLLNLSTGNNLANVSYAFVTTSPSDTPIHSGDINTPDIVGVWNTFVLNDSFPKPMNQIEWSGNPYTFFVIAKDSNGNVYTNSVQSAFICRPAGNFQASKNTFGLASSDVKVKCQEARVFFQDTTYATYKGLTGSQISSVLRVIYPIDETLTIPDPFVTGQYSTALVPISYSSSNYQFVQNSVYDYDLGNDTLVRIKYQTIQTFAVWCNVDLLPLVCEFNKLADMVANGNCSDINDAQNKLNLITPKMLLVLAGFEQPLIGVDVPKLVDEIIAIGGFDCDCCSAASGAIPTTASIIDGYSFSVNKLGGDVNGAFTTNGNNIVLNIGDVSYIVTMGMQSPSNVSAFSFDSVTNPNGFLKTYRLNIDGQQLAIDVLNNIGDNPAAINALNDLITVGASNFKLLVDGGCIFSTTASCDYTFTVSNIPASTTLALITSIKVGNITHPLNFGFNLLNLSALQAYLNDLNFGVFVVTNLGAGQVSIVADNNTNELIQLTYKTGSTNFIADFSRECTGFVPISANEVVQNIIDYLCGLTDVGVNTSQDYTVNYLDTTGTQQSILVNGGSTLNDLLIELIDAGNSNVTYIKSLSAVNCDSIKNVFPQNTITTLQANDFILGTKQGDCARIYPNELLLNLLQLGAFSQSVISAFCNLIVLCNSGRVCIPFSTLSVTTVFDSPADDNMSIVLVLSHPSATGYQFTVTRVDNGATGGFGGLISPIVSPHTFTGLPQGQYRISVAAIYAGGGGVADPNCPAQSIETAICGFITSFGLSKSSDNAHLYINYTASSPYIYVNLQFPNGSFYTHIYANTGAQIDILLSSVTSFQTGDYTVYLQPVCNVDTNWFGAATAPAVISIPLGTNSYRVSNTLASICATSPMTLYTPSAFGNGVVVYTDPGLTSPLTGVIYIADGTGAIYAINSSTGKVLYGIGANCNSGTANSVKLSNSSGTVCAASSSILYSNGAFVVGGILYTDSSITNHITGFTFVAYNGNIYNLDTSTGVVGSATGGTC